MTFSFEVRVSEQRTVIVLNGRLTFAEVGEFPKILAAIGSKDCDFDLRGLTAIDSTGLSLFIHAYDASKKGGVSISITGAQGAVASSVSRAGFGTLFPVS